MGPFPISAAFLSIITTRSWRAIMLHDKALTLPSVKRHAGGHRLGWHGKRPARVWNPAALVVKGKLAVVTVTFVSTRRATVRAVM